MLASAVWQDPVGPHGGYLKKAGNYTIEMKTGFPFFYTYLLGNRNKPISNRIISCRVMLLLPDHTETQIVMRRYGEDGFFSEAADLPASAYWISFEVDGETVSARFDDINFIVLNKGGKDHDTLKNQ